MITDLVSVVIPFFAKGNRAFLVDACRSIMIQTYPRVELLVVVNGPDAFRVRDELMPLLSRYSARVLVSDEAGIAAALNLGINHANGDLIARMDADDICHPDRLEKQVAWMEKHKLDICCAPLKFMTQEAALCAGTYWQPISNNAIRFCLYFFCALPHPTVIMRKATVLQYPAYVNMPFSEDYDLWLRLKRRPHIRFGAYPSPLLSYRLHSAQQTSKSNMGQIGIRDRVLKLREFRVTKNPLFLLGMLPLSGLVRRIVGRRVAM